MHMRNGILSMFWCGIEDVCNATIRKELSVHRHLQVFDLAICTKYFVKMTFVHVLCELFYYNLRASWTCWTVTTTATLAVATAPAVV